MSFVDVEVKQGSAELVAEALARLTALMEARGYIGWKPSPADILVIAFEALGPLAADVKGVEATVPEAAFRRYGTKLQGVSYNEGAAASATTLWTLTDSLGHTIPQGTQVAIGNLGFYVSSEVVVKPGESTAKVHVVAVEPGTEYNKLTGTVELVESIDWVKEVALEGETTGGSNQESDEEYANRLQAILTLQAPRPITASDYATFVRDAPSTVLPTGVVVGRSTAIDGYNPNTTAFTGTTTNKSKTLSEVSSFTGITVGTELEGAGIPANTTVGSVNTGAKTLEMSAEATASNSKEAISAIGSYENERCVTTFVTDKEGKHLSAEAMTALETWLKEHREIGFNTFVREPSYKTVYVTAKIHVLPGYSESTVIASVKSVLEAFLYPSTWANPTHQETGANSWLNRVQGYNVVRYNSLVGVIESVPGVAYVFPGAGGMAIGFSASPTGTSDLTLPGPAPLPETHAANLVVTAG